MARLGAITLALTCALEVRYPPYRRGISAILARFLYENERDPLRDTISKGYVAMWGVCSARERCGDISNTNPECVQHPVKIVKFRMGSAQTGSE